MTASWGNPGAVICFPGSAEALITLVKYIANGVNAPWMIMKANCMIATVIILAKTISFFLTGRRVEKSKSLLCCPLLAPRNNIG